MRWSGVGNGKYNYKILYINNKVQFVISMAMKDEDTRSSRYKIH